MALAPSVAQTVVKLTVGATLTQIEGLQTCGELTPASYGVNEQALLAGGPTQRATGKTGWSPVSFEALWCPIDAGHVAILADAQSDSPAAVAWEVATSLATNPGFAFDAFVSDLGLSFPNSGFVTLKGSFQPVTDPTPGAAGAVTPNASYVPTKSDGTTMTWGGTAVTGVENLEITGLSRAVVTAHAINATTPTLCGPSKTRHRANFAFDLLYDDAEVVHGTLKTAVGGAAAAVVITCTDTGAATVGFSCALTGWTHVVGAEANRVRVSGYLTTDITVTP